jgi:hypothetical protein
VPTAAPRVLVAAEDDIRALAGPAVRRAGADAHPAEPCSVAGLVARVHGLFAGATP